MYFGPNPHDVAVSVDHVWWNVPGVVRAFLEIEKV